MRITSSCLTMAVVLAAQCLASTVAADTASVADLVAALRRGSGDAPSMGRAAAGLPAAAPRTVTRAVTPRRGVSVTEVVFRFTADVTLQGFDVEVTYPRRAGSISGRGESTQCSSDGDGFFIVNDRDDGTMLLIQASAFNLHFPIDVRCAFERRSRAVLGAADLGFRVREVVHGGASSDTSTLHSIASVGFAPLPCRAGAVTITPEPGGMMDVGFTGLAHRLPIAVGPAFVGPLGSCNGDTCSFESIDTAGKPTGPPQAVVAAGVPVCLVSELAEPLTGTIGCGAPCATLQAHARIRTFLTADATAPCPLCVGDQTPNDGQRGGTCGAGATPGAACDAATATRFGATSSDCLPSAGSAGEADVVLSLSSSVGSPAVVDCADPNAPSGACHCEGQLRPNACSDGICSANGYCLHGPLECAGDGGCDLEPRPCFPSAIVRNGACATEGTVVGTTCMPATQSPAINTEVGLPGPVAAALPLRLQRTAEDACTPAPLGGCKHTGAGHESRLVLQRDPSGERDQLVWRWIGGAATGVGEFGDPQLGGDQAICVYGGTPNGAALLSNAEANVTDDCGADPCWKPKRNGVLVYRSPLPNPHGLTQMRLRSGKDGESQITVSGRGDALPLPALPLVTPLTVQLQAKTGVCFESVFDAGDVRHNDAKRFTATARTPR